VNKWVTIFILHPDLFPIVYKSGPIKRQISTKFDDLYDNKEDPYYVELEKLNSAKAKSELHKLELSINKSNISELLYPEDRKKYVFIEHMFYRALNDESLLDKYKKYMVFDYPSFFMRYRFLNKVKEAAGGKLDFNKSNFGYKP